MHFDFVDAVLELAPDRIVTLKNVSASEEYLQDHFPTFPVLPGVFMIEAMVHAARRLLVQRHPDARRHVLGSVKALKYGSFVRPGDALRVEVALLKSHDTAEHDFRGTATVIRPNASDHPTAVSGRFTLRPTRLN